MHSHAAYFEPLGMNALPSEQQPMNYSWFAALSCVYIRFQARLTLQASICCWAATRHLHIYSNYALWLCAWTAPHLKDRRQEERTPRCKYCAVKIILIKLQLTFEVSINLWENAFNKHEVRCPMNTDQPRGLSRTRLGAICMPDPQTYKTVLPAHMCSHYAVIMNLHGEEQISCDYDMLLTKLLDLYRTWFLYAFADIQMSLRQNACVAVIYDSSLYTIVLWMQSQETMRGGLTVPLYTKHNSMSGTPSL